MVMCVRKNKNELMNLKKSAVSFVVCINICCCCCCSCALIHDAFLSFFFQFIYIFNIYKLELKNPIKAQIVYNFIYEYIRVSIYNSDR